MKNLIYLIVLIFSFHSFSGQIKVRAREHFESHKIKTTTTSFKYKGLSNTINVWWEKPYEYSIGLSFSPVLSNLESDTSNTTFGDEIKLINIGIEFKYHLQAVHKSLFTRLGVGRTTLESDLASDLSGHFYYLGVGYEIPFDMFGLALEMAIRKASLDNDVDVDSVTPSIGFHFYKMI